MDDRGSYGWIAPESPAGVVRSPRGRAQSGFPVGILTLDDLAVPFLPGNVMNGWTYDFPVRHRAVPGLTSDELFEGADVLDRVIEAGRSLVLDGVRAISTGCGFFGQFQREVAAALPVPVAMSSLVQVPWLLTVLGGDARVGVLTANGPALSDALLTSCGIADRGRLVVADLGAQPEFNAIISDRGEFDDTAIRTEMAAAARSVAAQPGVAAILLECTEMPPYAALVQQVSGLPVFDFITVIRWLRFGVAQAPYRGFL